MTWAALPPAKRSVTRRSSWPANSLTPGQLAQERRRSRPGSASLVSTMHDVAHHFVATSHVARDDGLTHALELAQCRAQALGLLGGVMRQAPGTRLPQEADSLEDVLRRLLPEARQPREAAIERRLLQFRDRVDLERLVDEPDLGHAESRGSAACRRGRAAPGRAAPRAATPVRSSPPRARSAAWPGPMPLVAASVPSARAGARSPGRPGDRLRRGAEGADPEGILALELEEGRDLLEHLRGALLVDVATGAGCGHAVVSRARRARCCSSACERQPSSISSARARDGVQAGRGSRRAARC